MNRIEKLFTTKQNNILNVYCTAGYPYLEATSTVLTVLQQYGANMIEIGMPYSDPLADGPVIQQSNIQALENGMTIPILFEQLKNRSNSPHPELSRRAGLGGIPLILMGYMNPVLQFGIEKFCEAAAEVGVDGIILPDLPMYEFETQYQQYFKKHNLKFIFLVTPETSAERIKQIDKLSSGFVYAVSSSSTTGSSQNTTDAKTQEAYFIKLQQMNLTNPVLVGFGIKDKDSFNAACKYTNGAIIGSAYIKALHNTADVSRTTKDFINSIKG